MASPQRISVDDFRRLHRATIAASSEIRRILDELQRRGTWLTSGMDLSVRPRRAQVLDVRDDRVDLRLENIGSNPAQLHLNFELEGSRYFFDARILNAFNDRRVHVAIPEVLYRAERRDIPRAREVQTESVDLLFASGEVVSAAVVDRSYEGLGIELHGDQRIEVGTKLRVRTGANGESAPLDYATVRHAKSRPGWQRLGLSVTRVPERNPIEVQRRDSIRSEGTGRRAWRTVRLARAAMSGAPRWVAERMHLVRSDTPAVHVLEYENERNERLKGILDFTGDPEGAPAILIPPAWGRTKETLLPLATTLIQTFKAAGEPLLVFRYDERNRRGESYIDPECRASGNEGLHYTFSGAVEDVHTTARFLGESAFKPSRLLLLTVSLASIQGRRAVASDTTGLVAGWINLVGMPDLQSSMRAVTGGVDWVYGLSRGVRFGPQELVGVLVDMDRAGPDTLQHRLGFFEDARRDMAAIKVPVTWLHGKHDGWMSLDRVRDLMSAGQTEGRRLLQVPTGHQLRSSREALETFQLVAEEASEILLGHRLEGRPPELIAMERQRRAERSRRPPKKRDLQAFWHDYLVGRNGIVGMELMTATHYYREFMDSQISALALREGEHILDLGSGTGDLSLRICDRGHTDVRVTAVDLIAEALRRGSERLSMRPRDRVELGSIRANLDMTGLQRLPFKSGSFDAVVASLLVSYLSDPNAILGEAMRVLRPGGRIVVSSPRRDADISKLFSDTIEERGPERIRELFGDRLEDGFASHQAEFLNNAARVLEFEEEGRFRFFDPDELKALLRRAGFRSIRTALSFGDPPQFALASGEVR